MFDDRTRSRFEAMRWNSPLGEAHADRLLDELALERAGSLLDLGCGWGTMLVHAAARLPAGATATGVDTSDTSIEWGRALARERGLEMIFAEADITQWTQPADAVLCSGAAHAWPHPLQALRAVVSPGGRLLYGDAFWAAPPNPAAVEIFGEAVTDREGLIERATEAGWRVRLVSESSQAEWDEFEQTFRAGNENWARAHPDDPDAAPTLAEMERRREEYEAVYRGVLGFAFLVLEAPEPA
jgi:cyclopropane fatty-acyl-phospholipid synthase-like methyltransferase